MKSLSFGVNVNLLRTSAFTKAPANSNAIVASVFVGCSNSLGNDKCGDHFNVLLGDSPTSDTPT